MAPWSLSRFSGVNRQHTSMSCVGRDTPWATAANPPTTTNSTRAWMTRPSRDSRSGTTGLHLLSERESESEHASVLPDPLGRGPAKVGLDQGHVEAVRLRGLPGGARGVPGPRLGL